jgi:hypothetical protein
MVCAMKIGAVTGVGTFAPKRNVPPIDRRAFSRKTFPARLRIPDGTTEPPSISSCSTAVTGSVPVPTVLMRSECIVSLKTSQLSKR